MEDFFYKISELTFFLNKRPLLTSDGYRAYLNKTQEKNILLMRYRVKKGGHDGHFWVPLQEQHHHHHHQCTISG